MHHTDWRLVNNKTEKLFCLSKRKKKNRIQEKVNTLDVSWAGMELGFEPFGGGGGVMNRVWLVEFEDNCASKNREEVRTEY